MYKWIKTEESNFLIIFVRHLYIIGNFKLTLDVIDIKGLKQGTFYPYEVFI
jgi:hypothetical protein